jgi:hypothetical protein
LLGVLHSTHSVNYQSLKALLLSLFKSQGHSNIYQLLLQLPLLREGRGSLSFQLITWEIPKFFPRNSRVALFAEWMETMKGFVVVTDLILKTAVFYIS